MKASQNYLAIVQLLALIVTVLPSSESKSLPNLVYIFSRSRGPFSLGFCPYLIFMYKYGINSSLLMPSRNIPYDKEIYYLGLMTLYIYIYISLGTQCLFKLITSYLTPFTDLILCGVIQNHNLS